MYLKWQEKTIADFSEQNINDLYDHGFLFTRVGKGAMYQTRSVRIDLDKFELSSENRRVLRKIENVAMETTPIPYSNYSWEIGKLGKNFYEQKFGEGIFSANKIKELLTNKEKSNFNLLLVYNVIARSNSDEAISSPTGRSPRPDGARDDSQPAGYSICYSNAKILHYSYPFYNLQNSTSNIGIGMMTRAIEYAKKEKRKYVYLGSAKDNAALYKFQFAGVEWFDGKIWQSDIEKLKNTLK